MRKQWKQWQTIFLGSKITADGDCSHEIKWCLLLGRKAMTNLDSILKSRHITLLTKVHVVKAVIFPVVMYGYKSWTIKKVEHRRTDAFELWCWRRLLRVPWTARRSNQSILKKIIPEYHWRDGCWSWSSNTLATWRKELTHWKRLWCWGRLKSEKRATEAEMVWWHHQFNGNELGQTPGDGEGQGSLACCSAWVCWNSCPLSQWCHPTISSSLAPSPFAFNLSQHHGLFQWICSSHQVAKVLELQL